MKKKFSMVTIAIVASLGLVACGGTTESAGDKIKIGRMTDSGTINDKSFKPSNLGRN